MFDIFMVFCYDMACMALSPIRRLRVRASRIMKQKTYYIIIIGCQMNKSDSERIAGYLERRGYALSDSRDKADLVVVTTCGVRQSAEDRVYGLAPRIKKANPKVKIILTGCLSLRKDVRRRLKKYIDIWMPITQLDGLARDLESKAQITDKESGKITGGYFKINPKYNSKFSAFVPIGNGCDNFCAYCVVPHARGREVYRDADEILKEVEVLVGKGYREIILIAQNVNSYQSKISNSKFQIPNKFKIQNSKSKTINFPDLLKLANDIPGDFWIRFSTSHPKDMSDDLISAVAECEKVCEHIHLPVQAGDNEVLKRMNRKYTVEHYIGLIKKIRKTIPGVCVTTDVIVGFPGETEEQFNETVNLFKQLKFYLAYVSQYSPRYGTASAKMEDDVPRKEKKRREDVLMDILRKTALEENKKYIGKTVEVLVEGKNNKGEWYGKTRTFKNVKFEVGLSSELGGDLRLGRKNLVGNFVSVGVKKAEDFRLKGEVVK